MPYLVWAARPHDKLPGARVDGSQLMIDGQQELPVRLVLAFPIVDPATRDDAGGRIGRVGPDLFPGGRRSGRRWSSGSPAQRARREPSAD